MRVPVWARPWMWRSLLARRRALRLDAEYRERRERVRWAGCDCGRTCRGSAAGQRKRAWKVCPVIGCTKKVAKHES